jgi:methylated-DNA-[protein]-cysteine S-methyltransferase
MASHGYTLFDTTIGRCGVRGAKRIVAVQLPEARDIDTPIRLARRAPAHRKQPPDERGAQSASSRCSAAKPST